jgi:regulatory protein
MARAAIAMRVARVRAWPRDPSIVLVDIEGAGTYRLSAETSQKLALSEGSEIDGNLLARIDDAASIRDGTLALVRLLQRRLRSRAELQGALRRRGLSGAHMTAVIADLARAGWIDDARFARAWIEDRLALRPKGARALRAELRARGVAAEVIEASLDTLLSQDREAVIALDQAKRRLERLSRLPAEVARRRLVGWLRRRGFSAGVIGRTFRALGHGGGGGSDAGSAA